MLTSLYTLFSLTAIWLIQSHVFAIRRNGRRLRTPPGALPFAGYGLRFMQPRHKLLDWFAHIQSGMGFETFALPVPSLPPAVLINDPKLLEQILKDTSTFVKGSFFRCRSEDLFRDGILNADGELWRTQRKAGLRFLSASRLESFIDQALPPLLDDAIGLLNDAANEGQVIDLQEHMLALTTRFMGTIAYDMDITSDMPFSKAFEYASIEVGHRFTNPFWKLKHYFFGRPLRDAVDVVHDFSASIVANANRGESKVLGSSEAPQSTLASSTRGNLISTLLRHLDSPSTVAAAAMNFLSAGRDTTAQSLAWTFYHLMRNPLAVHRLRGSLDTGVSKTRTLKYSDVTSQHNTVYMSAIFAESLRLSPPIPLEIKETTRAIVLNDGTSLPSRAVVIWSPYAMARNPKIWGKDAANFRPERWLTPVDAIATYNFHNGQGTAHWQEEDFSQATFVSNLKTPFENPVFNGGPRACIGKQLAEMLAAVVVSRIIREFDVQMVDMPVCQEDKVGQDGLTMPISGGLWVSLTSRE